MELDQVYKTVVAEVNPVFVPDSSKSKFLKDLEKQSGVTCNKVNQKKRKPAYNLEGTLSSIQKAASYIQSLYSTRHEALEKDSSEEGCRVSVDGKSSRNYTVSSSRQLKLVGSHKPQGNDEELGRFALDKTYKDSSFDLPSRDRSERYGADYSRSGSYQKQPTATELSSKYTRNGKTQERYSEYGYALDSDTDCLVNSRATKSKYTGSQKQPPMGSDANFETSALGKPKGYSTCSRDLDLQSTSSERQLFADETIVSEDCQILNFSTPKTHHKICLYNGDLTKIKADAVVCSTNPYLSHSGGLAKAIARIGGSQVLEAANQYTETHGVLLPAQVTHLKGGKLPSKYVIYTVGPIWKDFKNKVEFSSTLKNTFINCFHYASKTLGITHIALPLIGSGISGAPADKCSEALYSALMEFDGTSNVFRPMDIHIVDRDVDSVVYLQKLFFEYNLNNTSLEFGNDTTHNIGEHLNGRDDYDANPSVLENSPVVRDFPTEITHKTKKKENSRIDNAPDMNFRRSLSYESLHASPRHYGPDKTTDTLSGKDFMCKLSFRIPKLHRVSIYLGDLTRIKADAIVNAANSYLKHDGGVARAIVKVGGHQIKKESDEYIKKYGPIYPSKVIHTSGGNLPSPYVIHAVGPIWNDYRNETECLKTLKETFMNCLYYASNSLKIRKLAIPLISSGIFGVPLDKCVTALYKALMVDAVYESILDIHIVDSNPESVNILQIIFCDYLKSDNIPFTKTESASHFSSNSDISNGQHCFAAPNMAESCSSTTMFNAEKTKKLSSREKESSSNFIKLFLKKRSKNDKENCDGINTQKEKVGKHSDFRVKNNLKISPTNGPMKALSSHDVDTDRETHIKELIDEHEKRGNPVSEFKNLQVKMERILDKKTKSNRSKSLSRLPNQSVKPQSVSGERQSRRDSTKIGNNQRSQSYDRHQKRTDDRSMSTNMNQKQGQWSQEDFSMERSSSLGNVNQKPSGMTPQNQKYESLAQRESDARRRRREKQISNDITHNLSQTNDSTSVSQMENIGLQISMSQSKLKKHAVDNFLIPLPPPVVGSCPICLTNFQDQDSQDPVSLNSCGHSFCRKCIQHAFKTKPLCPVCSVVYGCFVGNQPDGTMDIDIKHYSLPGYPDAGTIVIHYNIPSGIQNDSHPNPGRPYTGTSRTAYLPATDEGRDICRLLKKAFDAKLIFTVGMSVTTGRMDTVTWNDIHHKTHRTGGSSHFGYPDDSYLKRVREELASKGIH